MNKSNKSKIIELSFVLSILFTFCLSACSNNNETLSDTIVSIETDTDSVEIETVDEPKEIDLCDTDTDYKEYSIIVDNRFSTYGYYHCNENCSQLKNINESNREHYIIKTSSISDMESYFYSNNLHSCDECVDWSSQKQVEKEVESAKERELKTEKVDLCSDADGEEFYIVYDIDENMYHIDEECRQIKYRIESYKNYYIINAKNIDDIEKFFKSKGIDYCTQCVKLETDTNTETANTSLAVSSESTYVELPQQATTYHFIINEDTKKFHLPSCHKGEEILPEHRKEMDITDEKLSDAIQRMIGMGYSPCGICLD